VFFLKQTSFLLEILKMVAAVESMAFNQVVTFENGVPWHGLGRPVVDESDLFDLIQFEEKAGLNWGVHKEPLVTVPQAQSAVNYAFSAGLSGEECPEVKENVDHYAVVRDTDKRILGVVGPRWTPLQNREVFEWFQPWLDNKLVALNTAGSLFDGQKVWVLAQVVEDTVHEVVKGDNVARFILLSNSHDGTTAARPSFTSIRVVCANTLRLAENKASSMLRVRHSSKVKSNLEAIRDIMDLAKSEFSATIEQYRYLASKQINKEDLRKYVRILVQDEKLATTQKWDDVPTRSQNIILDIERLVDDPIQKVGISGTWWNAYNAYNGYLNHKQGRNSDNRLNSLWFGTNEASDKQAFNLALSFADNALALSV
jgi:phage/plasmid-like protein (TIGR03299 family)